MAGWAETHAADKDLRPVITNNTIELDTLTAVARPLPYAAIRALRTSIQIEQDGDPFANTERSMERSLLDPLWTIQDVSVYLAVPVGTLYQWRHRGEGPPAIRLGRHLRYDPDSVRRWALSQAS
jgi:excisionase family DNA binding protein